MELTEEQKIKIIESDHRLRCIKFNINTLTFECRGLWKRGQRFFLFPMVGTSSHFSEIEITHVNQAEYDFDSPDRWELREKYYYRGQEIRSNEEGYTQIYIDRLKEVRFRFIGKPFGEGNSWCGTGYLYCTVFDKDCLKVLEEEQE